MLQYSIRTGRWATQATARVQRRLFPRLLATTPFRGFTQEVPTQPQAPTVIHPPFVPLEWGDQEQDASDVEEMGSDTEVQSGAGDDATRPGLPADFRQKDLYSRQYDLEMLALQRTVARYKELCSSVIQTRNASGLGPSQRLLARWFGPLEAAIDKEQKAIADNEYAMDRHSYGPKILLLPPDKLAAITMHETLNTTLFYGGHCRFLVLAKAIGKMVQAEIGMQKMRSERRREWAKLQNITHRRTPTLLHNARQALDDLDWHQRTLIKVGACLLNLLLQTAMVPINERGELQTSINLMPLQAADTKLHVEGQDVEASSDVTLDLMHLQSSTSAQAGSINIPNVGLIKFEPAFRHSVRTFGNMKRIGIVDAHPAIADVLVESSEPRSLLAHFPMLVPPRPWTLLDKGPYLNQRVPLMRVKSKSSLHSECVRLSDMPKVLDALNVVGRVGFRINQFVLDTILKVWEEGGGVGEIPSRQDSDLPAALEDDIIADPSPEAKQTIRRYWMTLARAKQHNRDLHSLRCDLKLKLEVADMFKDDVMYFPHNLDFRGRIYPIPPHLNHMGADFSRGLLTFAHGKPLGERGLRWLKIHLSNLMGNDKASFEGRIKFTEEHMDRVFDSADKPLEGDRWWLSTDSPWQALATCKELANAMRCKVPEEYICSLPVHQDGSCNGLQHYAALGRDALGGAAVNLTPGVKPGDVYSDVCAVVKKRMASDRLEPRPGESAPPKVIADWEKRQNVLQWLDGKVDRKVVKQTVMTSVYGVTFAGARAQIRARLKEKFEHVDLPVEVKDELTYQGSMYLARLTLESIGELFAGADAIKDWLATCAKMIAMERQPVCWITPLGLPVVQPYRQMSSLVVKTLLQDVLIAENDDQLPVSVARQKSAFPPNYVHSLDSTHMMMTALDCAAKGLTFTAVHDSYWTHACDVDTMNQSLRSQFIALYEMPLLEQLRDMFVLRFPKLDFPPLPPRGSLDLELVKQSPYFFN